MSKYVIMMMMLWYDPRVWKFIVSVCVWEHIQKYHQHSLKERINVRLRAYPKISSELFENHNMFAESAWKYNDNSRFWVWHVYRCRKIWVFFVNLAKVPGKWEVRICQKSTVESKNTKGLKIIMKIWRSFLYIYIYKTYKALRHII